MAGLSQRDLVLSQRAEAQLEQQKRDQELARRLQGQLELGSYFTKSQFHISFSKITKIQHIKFLTVILPD